MEYWAMWFDVFFKMLGLCVPAVIVIYLVMLWFERDPDDIDLDEIKRATMRYWNYAEPVEFAGVLTRQEKADAFWYLERHRNRIEQRITGYEETVPPAEHLTHRPIEWTDENWAWFVCELDQYDPSVQDQKANTEPEPEPKTETNTNTIEWPPLLTESDLQARREKLREKMNV